MKKVTVGIVGCGFAADLHMRAFRMIRGIEVEIPQPKRFEVNY